MSNSLDPDQARQNVGPDLDTNCLPMLLADDTDGLRVKDCKQYKIISDFVSEGIVIICADIRAPPPSLPASLSLDRLTGDHIQIRWERSGSVSRPRGRGFEPHRRHCVASLRKTH